VVVWTCLIGNHLVVGCSITRRYQPSIRGRFGAFASLRPGRADGWRVRFCFGAIRLSCHWAVGRRPPPLLLPRRVAAGGEALASYMGAVAAGISMGACELLNFTDSAAI
jgi:hypothetical protein